MKKIAIHLRVNHAACTFEIRPGDILLDVLRREGYYGVKRGCETGNCGSCTVLLDGKPINSCILFAAQADGREILTVEGLATNGKLHPIQEAFLDHGAVQCGFCAPGTILSAKALLDSNPRPTENEVRAALNGNLCRCTGYVKIVEAVMAAAGGRR